MKNWDDVHRPQSQHAFHSLFHIFPADDETCVLHFSFLPFPFSHFTLIIKFTTFIFTHLRCWSSRPYWSWSPQHRSSCWPHRSWYLLWCGQDAREPCSGPACRGAWQFGEAREEFGQKQVDNIRKVELLVPRSHHKYPTDQLISGSLIHLLAIWDNQNKDKNKEMSILSIWRSHNSRNG